MAFWNSWFNRKHADQYANADQYDENRNNHQITSDALDKNPNMALFNKARNNINDIIDSRSVISQFSTDDQVMFSNPYYSTVMTGITAMPVLSNKTERIRQYRSMATHPECDFCLCEIADDVIHEDEEGEIIHLTLPDNKIDLDQDKKDILQDQFTKFIDFFNLRDDGYNLIKRFLIEGEIAFENIINREHPELGIVGVKYLPTEYYETLADTETGRPIGIFFNKEMLEKDSRNIISNSCIGNAQIFNNMISNGYRAFNKDKCIPLLWPQVTYISSDDFSPDGLIHFPLIDKCKKAFHQLALLEESAVILRVTRAPERLLFNIDVGGYPEKKAQAKIQNFADSLKSKRILMNGSIDGSVRGNGNPLTQSPQQTTVYNPVSMLESYYFGKTSANDGTTVETVSSTADYEQMADIEFFLRRLFKQFKVPFSRYKTPENTMERDDTISYEEYSMMRMIIRIQRRIAKGLRDGYITHLKLMGLWRKYNLKEADIKVNLVLPVLYDIYQKQKLVSAKMDTYAAATDADELSRITAMKKILGMSDDEIRENFQNLILEKQWVAAADYYSDLLGEDHKPVDLRSPMRLDGVDNQKAAPGTGVESEGGEEGGESRGGMETGGGEGGESGHEENESEPERTPHP